MPKVDILRRTIVCVGALKLLKSEVVICAWEVEAQVAMPRVIGGDRLGP